MGTFKQSGLSRKSIFSRRRISVAVIEGLENRRLLSVASAMCDHGSGSGTSSSSGSSSSTALPANGATIEFSQTPTVVQTGLDALAATDAVTAPAAAQEVYLNNQDGVETYTVDITGTGTQTALTVDVNGKPVTAPVKSTTTWGTLDGTGTGNNAATAAEITAVAAAKNLTAPTDSTTINVTTYSDGTSIYTIKLSSAAGSSNSHAPETKIIVDSNGNLVGDQKVPFSTLAAAVQNGLIASAPASAGLTSSSTQTVFVSTYDGVPTYSMTFTSTGTVTTITVNSSGTLVNKPSQTTTTFSAIPAAAQTELQTLATADGDSTAIPTTQNVLSYSQANGTTVYSVFLTTDSGENFTISVDQLGNPTVPPKNSGGGFFHGWLGGGSGGFGFGGGEGSGGGGGFGMFGGFGGGGSEGFGGRR